MTVPMIASEASAADVSDEFGFTRQDWTALRTAVVLLERTSLATRLTQMLGRQVTLATSFIPPALSDAVARAVNLALRAAVKTAIRSLGDSTAKTPSSRAHRAMAVASGAAGGALGLATLPIELPISTTLMLRSIADVARSQGEDLSTTEAALACLEVFALSGDAGSGSLESGYFAVRALLAQTLSEAARYLLKRGALEEGGPVLLRLISLIAARFGAVVTQKVVAQAVPVLGAVSGAAINYAFMEHFQNLALGHFTVRRLERAYGPAQVRRAYEQIRLSEAGDRAKPT